NAVGDVRNLHRFKSRHKPGNEVTRACLCGYLDSARELHTAFRVLAEPARGMAIALAVFTEPHRGRPRRTLALFARQHRVIDWTKALRVAREVEYEAVRFTGRRARPTP